MTLSLRKFEKRDIGDLFSWFETEREALQWAGAALSWPLKRREFIALIKQHRGPSPVREVWAVMQGDEMVGHFQIGLNRRLRTAGLGRIAIAPIARGQGLSVSLMELILDRAFSYEWVHRADLLVYSHNQAAIRTYRAAGFQLEGTRRESTPIGDEIWDTHIMSLLRREFDKRTERE
nr:GNAT family protein [Hyphomonas sp. Mor2]